MLIGQTGRYRGQPVGRDGRNGANEQFIATPCDTQKPQEASDRSCRKLGGLGFVTSGSFGYKRNDICDYQHAQVWVRSAKPFLKKRPGVAFIAQLCSFRCSAAVT
ncbi:hypothetical protein DESC_810052 [Desulfosarcina cetonica]|nr:hypothetical protein DESC_810052 [Desulfosarcina cetonica]